MAVKPGEKATSGRQRMSWKVPNENIRRFAAYFTLATALWVWGYLGVSFSWIILCLAIAGVWEYRQNARTSARWKNRTRMAAITNREGWACNFDDVESASWLNNCLALLWPQVDRMARNVLKESVEPELQKKLPSSLKSLSFQTIDLGRKPPRLTNIKTYSSKDSPAKRSEFIIDVDVAYCGDAKIKIAVKGVQLGIADLHLRGPIRIILKPLLSDRSIIGGITVFFRKRPKLSFDLTNLLNVLDFPGLKDTLRSIIDDIIASVAVLPNRIVVPLAGNVDASELRYPMPEGVLQVELIEARDLKKTDVSLIGKASSDPYAVVKIGAKSYHSAVKKNNLNPVWNETFEAFVDNCEGQDLEVSLYDKDVSKDESLGHVELSISALRTRGPNEFWTPFGGVSQGRVLLRASWFFLSESPLDLYPPEEHGSVAALFVKIKSAENLLLPAAGKVFCRVTVGGESQATFETVGGGKTEWNQLLRFLLKDPFSQAVVIEVVRAKDESILGRLSFNTSPLIDETEMTFEDSFRLEKSDGQGTLTCKFMLRAFKVTGIIATSQAAEGGARDVISSDAKSHDVMCNDVKSHDVRVDDVDHRDGPINDAAVVEDPESVSPPWSETSSSSSSNQPEKKDEPSPSGSLFCIVPPPEITKPVKGEIVMDLVYSHRRNRLVVKLQRARGLVLDGPKPKAKPYVTLYLLPDRTKKSLRQTFVYPNSRNPVFDEVFEYVVGLDQLRERKLEVTVKNARTSVLSNRSRNVIGKAIVDLSELDLTNGEALSCEIRG